jgi:hypothetical protein
VTAVSESGATENSQVSASALAPDATTKATPDAPPVTGLAAEGGSAASVSNAPDEPKNATSKVSHPFAEPINETTPSLDAKTSTALANNVSHTTKLTARFGNTTFDQTCKFIALRPRETRRHQPRQLQQQAIHQQQ